VGEVRSHGRNCLTDLRFHVSKGVGQVSAEIGQLSIARSGVWR
jgi:hypothetical protein